MQTPNRALVRMSLVCAAFAYLAGCKAGDKSADTSAGGAAPAAAPAKQSASGMLTKEEVSAILGEPVVSVEGQGHHLTYKTSQLTSETSIEVDLRHSADDAVGGMTGARKATSMLGGTPEPVANLGDEAFFGAMSTLYMRKGSVIATIQAPNYQQLAQMAAAAKVQEAKSADETRKAMDELQQISRNDPGQAGLQAGDATHGAMAAINAASKKQGSPYEARQRAVAVALATKLLEKL